MSNPEREQELITTSFELREQFKELEATYKRENIELRAQVKTLQDELKDIGVSRKELDEQALALAFARSSTKDLVKTMIGWEYMIRKASIALGELYHPNDRLVEGLLDIVVADIDEGRRQTARYAKDRFKTFIHGQMDTSSIDKTRQARIMRRKFAVDRFSRFENN